MPVQKAGPDPATIHPLPGVAQIGFLKPIVDHPRIEIGDYTYYDDPAGPEHFVDRCVRYHFEHIGDRLIIGRFCAIASGVEFIMNGANHLMDRLSTYPFEIFGQGWEDETVDYAKASRGDTVVGNDVWIGTGATIMPGVKIRGDWRQGGGRAGRSGFRRGRGQPGGNPQISLSRRDHHPAYRHRMVGLACGKNHPQPPGNPQRRHRSAGAFSAKVISVSRFETTMEAA